jgi:hypothetical protein
LTVTTSEKIEAITIKSEWTKNIHEFGQTTGTQVQERARWNDGGPAWFAAELNHEKLKS